MRNGRKRHSVELQSKSSSGAGVIPSSLRYMSLRSTVSYADFMSGNFRTEVMPW